MFFYNKNLFFIFAIFFSVQASSGGVSPKPAKSVFGIKQAHVNKLHRARKIFFAELPKNFVYTLPSVLALKYFLEMSLKNAVGTGLSATVPLSLFSALLRYFYANYDPDLPGKYKDLATSQAKFFASLGAVAGALGGVLFQAKGSPVELQLYWGTSVGRAIAGALAGAVAGGGFGALDAGLLLWAQELVDRIEKRVSKTTNQVLEIAGDVIADI